DIKLNQAVVEIEKGWVKTDCIHTGKASELAADAVVLVTCRLQNDDVWTALKARQPDWGANGVRSIKVIGDAQAPGPIAWATYAGHRFARELDEPDIGDALPFRRELAELQD
ncbi:MAG: NADH:flavin oxidoreductase, partial [Alphaproteobacteria bacterium]